MGEQNDRPDFEPACRATALGSLPLTDARQACELVLQYFPEIPAWPQLPQRAHRENMYAQFCEGLPGAVIDGGKLYVDRTRIEMDLEKLYVAYLGGQAQNATISAYSAEGLPTLLSMKDRLESIIAIKGHVTGPISMGLQVTDQERRPILYDEILADALSKLLHLKAAWQEDLLRSLCPQTIIFVDEPYLSTFSSTNFPVSREQMVMALEEVLDGIQGLKGIHCCGNTDWSLLLATSMDVISFDAYHYAVPFSLHAAEIKTFLRRGGIIAWGIVPNEPDLLEQETVESLTEKLLLAVDLLVHQGLSREDVLARALITATCGLGSVPVAGAIRACELTAGLSAWMRAHYL